MTKISETPFLTIVPTPAPFTTARKEAPAVTLDQEGVPARQCVNTWRRTGVSSLSAAHSRSNASSPDGSKDLHCRSQDVRHGLGVAAFGNSTLDPHRIVRSYRRRAKNLGLSWLNVLDEAGISRRTYYRWKRGTVPTFTKLNLIRVTIIHLSKQRRERTHGRNRRRSA